MKKKFVQKFSLPRLLDSSIRWRLWSLLVLTIFTILLTITAFTTVILNRDSSKTIIAASDNLVYQSGENLEKYFKNIEDASLVPYSNAMLYTLLSASSLQPYTLDSYVDLALHSIAAADPSVSRVYLYVGNTSISYLFQDSRLSKGMASPPELTDTIQLFPAHEGQEYSLPAVGVSELQTSVLTLQRPLYRVPEDTYMGLLNIDMDLSYLSSVLSKIINSPEESVYLLNQQGQLIYSQSEEISPHMDLDKVLSSENSHGVIYPDRWNKNAEIILFHRFSLESGPLTLVKTIPQTVLTAGSSTLNRLNWLAALICLSVSSILFLTICSRFTAPIQQLVKHMERIGQGELTERISTDRNDEIGTLIGYFQAMMDNINDLLQTQYRLELSNKTNQLLALQSQLNPHFISNTIQSIGTSALKSGNKEVYIQLSSFGNIMQYCMDFKHTMVHLEQEMEYVERYLSFQKARFSDRFVFSIHTAPDVSRFTVPKMLLQPLVENAFKHGHVQERANGFVLIVAEHTDDCLIITISDNGDGADEEKLRSLRTHMEQLTDQELCSIAENIGILNAFARIRLHYGHTANITFGNRKQGGFELTITLPRQEVVE